MSSKQKIIKGVDTSADSETKIIARTLTEKEAMLLANRITSEVIQIGGATPITSIIELRRIHNRISYKLKFTVILFSSMSF